jgi:serine/threonine protein kinase
VSGAPFEANQQFGQYTLVRPIALGGMAEVWLAKLDGPVGFQKKVALKRMTGTISENPQFVSMFLDEARLMSSLTHPNICQVYELGQKEESFYVAMEFIDGQTVQHIMRAVVRAQAKVPLPLAVKIIRDAADALQYAHTKTGEDGQPLRIIHRDVSPQNLMVTYEGVPKLLDFGIAKAATRSNSTEVGQLKGKLSYMPPEQARGEALDPRADQFSLGVTLFEMLTHTRLYPALQEMDLFRLVAFGTDPYDQARQRDPSIPDELNDVVVKMMSRDPAQRYASMAEVRDALTGFLHDTSRTTASTEALTEFMRVTFPPEVREQQQSKLSSSSYPRVPTGTGASKVKALRSSPARTAVLVGLGLVGVSALAVAFWPSEPPPEPPVGEPPPIAQGVTPPPVADVPTPVPGDVGPAPPEDAGVVVAVSDPDLAPLAALDAGVKPKAVVAKGKLSLTTTPWSVVTFGKKSLGETPLVNVPMPVGTHRLVLINDERNLKTTIEVEIKPNQTTTMKLKL